MNYISKRKFDLLIWTCQFLCLIIYDLTDLCGDDLDLAQVPHAVGVMAVAHQLPNRFRHLTARHSEHAQRPDTLVMLV